MKKFAIMVMAAVFAMAVTGCASSSSSSASSSATSSSASASASSESAFAGMANPWSEAASASDAAQKAGLDSFVVPESQVIGGVEFRSPVFTCMENIAQADYSQDNKQLTIRKGKGVSGREFHGDYNDYPAEWTQDVNGVHVTCWGNEQGKANLATWAVGEYSFALYCNGSSGESFGVSDSELPAIVGSVQ